MPPKPKCPDCGSPLYKSASAKSKPEKDFVHCRNKNCARARLPKPQPATTPYPAWDQSDGVPGLVDDGPKLRAPTRDYPRGDFTNLNGVVICALCYELNGDCGQCIDTRAVITPRPVEPEHPAIAKTRTRIRELLSKADATSHPASTIGIMLALLAQETGNYAAADALIKEHKLDETLGLLPKSETT